MSHSRPDRRSERLRREDEHALAKAEEDGYVVRLSPRHRAHALYARRCRERGLPCVCVYRGRRLSDVTLDMPDGRTGWILGEDAQRAVSRVLDQVPCAAQGVGPRRVAACGVSIYQAGDLARRLGEIASRCRPGGAGGEPGPA